MPDSLPPGLPARLRALRERAGLSAFDLARSVGTTEQTLRNIERGDHQPKVAVVARLAGVLGVTLDELCGPTPVWPVWPD